MVTLLELLAKDTMLRCVGVNHKRQSPEFAGPCPFCGGTDRFRVWPGAAHPHYWCRRCQANGDAIAYLRTHDKMSFLQACRFLGILPEEHSSSSPPISSPSVELDPPNAAWQQRARWFCHLAEETLWSEQGTGMRAYLHSRGFSDESIRRAGLGYHPTDRKELAAAWGLESERPIWLPAGLVIPGVIASIFWRINIRTGQAHRPYVAVAGSLSPLYQADLLGREKPAMLLESDLDALLVRQEAGNLVSPVATEGTSGARHLYWMSYLASPPCVLISYDADEAGDRAAAWWLAHLPHARRWRPLVKDPGEMHRLGINVQEWVEDVLSLPRGPLAQAVLTTPARDGTTPPAPKVVSIHPEAQRDSLNPKRLQPVKTIRLQSWQILLNNLPQGWRHKELAIAAAKAYCSAGEPKVSVLLWNGCAVPDRLSGVTLWQILGGALAAEETTRARAVGVLERLAVNGGLETLRRGS